MSLNRCYRKTRKDILDGKNPFAIIATADDDEYSNHCLTLFHCLFHSSHPRKRRKWFPAPHHHIINTHFCNKGYCSEDVEEHLLDENAKWDREKIFCEKKGCHQGDLHLRYCKHFRYRLRPTIVLCLLQQEKEWHVLDDAIKFFSGSKGVKDFGQNRDANRKRSLLYWFLLEEYLLREFREIVGEDCYRLVLEFLDGDNDDILQEKLSNNVSLCYSKRYDSRVRVCEDGCTHVVYRV